MALKAIVRAGRLVLDEPADLPDGTVIELVVDDEAEVMSADQLRDLDARLSQAARAILEGHGVSGDEVIAKLRTRSS